MKINIKAGVDDVGDRATDFHLGEHRVPKWSTLEHH